MSLAAQEYYGNPRNTFWRIMGEVLGFDAGAPYPQRVTVLLGHQIAVWDVLRSCRRAGSLDSAIERDSMVANDFESFFESHPGISRVIFNGAAAEANFSRLARCDGAPAGIRVPSTSPAQTMRYADKLKAWRAALSG